MARVNATAAKAAAATAAADLTTILQDDTLTELFNDYKQNHHPMRGIEKLFLLDPATGVVSANDDYIDAAYAGSYPVSGIESGRQSVGVPTPLSLVSATLETAAPKNIVLTFARPMVDRQEMNASIAGAAAAGKKITTVEVDFAIITITTDVAFIAADVVTVSGRFFGSNVYIDLTAQAVTNNIV